MHFERESQNCPVCKQAVQSLASSHTQISANHKPLHLYDAISLCLYDAIKAGASAKSTISANEREVHRQRWQEPSRQLVNPPAVKPRGSSSLPKPPVRALRPPAASRSLIATGPAQWLCERSVAIRSPPSCWSASYLSSAWCEKSLRTSRRTCASRAPLSWPCRSLARLT